jgi:hypothetical protein
MRPALVALAVVLVLTLAAREARACGGFFCNTPTPVDQTAEQIIFARNGDKAETYVQIRFTGQAADFGWIVPVTQVPEKIEVSDAAVFNDLQTLTGPQFLAPPGANASSGCSGGGCGSSDFASPTSAGAEDKGVDVVGTGSVGPFDWVVLKSDKADDLITWLNDRHYNVSPDAKTLVQGYLDEKALFVALKLVPEATSTDIKPVKFTFPTWEPCVPLKLTSVSAQPDLGVLVYVLGDTRAVPGRYGQASVDDAQIRFQFSQFGNTNYRTLLGQEIDKLGGRAFTTEFAGRTSTLLPRATTEATRTLLKSAPYLTRLYSVISPEEMTADPIFTLSDAGNLPDVSNIHQLGDAALGQSAAGPLLTALSLGAAALLRRRRRS